MTYNAHFVEPLLDARARVRVSLRLLGRSKERATNKQWQKK